MCRLNKGLVSNLLFRQIERELLPLCQEEGVAVIPYNPLAGGLLSGKHRHGAGPAAGTRFTLGTAAGRYQERYWHEREFQTVEALRPLAAAAGMSMAQMAVAWALAHPAITAPISSSTASGAVTIKLRGAVRGRAIRFDWPSASPHPPGSMQAVTAAVRVAASAGSSRSTEMWRTPGPSTPRRRESPTTCQPGSDASFSTM